MERRVREDAHPGRDDAAWRDDPRLGQVIVRRQDTAASDLADDPGDAVDNDVRADAGDDPVCDAARWNSASARRGGPM